MNQVIWMAFLWNCYKDGALVIEESNQCWPPTCLSSLFRKIFLGGDVGAVLCMCWGVWLDSAPRGLKLFLATLPGFPRCCWRLSGRAFASSADVYWGWEKCSCQTVAMKVPAPHSWALTAAIVQDAFSFNVLWKTEYMRELFILLLLQEPNFSIFFDLWKTV